MNEPTTNPTILNAGLELAMEFGADWLKPIQERLAAKFPGLSTNELNKCNKICRAAMKLGHSFVYQTLEEMAKQRKQITQEGLQSELQKVLSASYPWVNDANFSKLLSQSIYYAYKDGLHLALRS